MIAVSSGYTACNTTVHRLIGRVANRLFANGDLEAGAEQFAVSFPATQASMSEYYRLERFADREDYHARLQTFVGMGAVSAEWDRSAGERGQLARVTIVNPAAAADLLRCDLPWDIALKAIRSFKSVAGEGRPVIDRIIDGWRHGKSPGGVAAENAGQFIDALLVIDTAQRLGGEEKDLVLRRLSAHLFGDSKRIESLARQIAFLVGEPEAADGEDIFARLGLVKYPQPMLLSGPASCCVRAGDQTVPFVQPYLGLRPDIIESLQVGNTPIKRLVTIENLASFNEAAQDLTNPKDLLLIYVAGNPTPSLLAAYGRILKSVKPEEVLHWGDIDVGGFRIAARLAERALEVGYRLELWHMNPAESATTKLDKASGDKIDRVVTICEKYGWIGEMEGVKQHPVFQEQEFINWEPTGL